MNAALGVGDGYGGGLALGDFKGEAGAAEGADGEGEIAFGEAGGDFTQIRRTGNAVEQAETEEQKCGGHATKQKVFQRGLGGFFIVLVERGDDVEREAGEFQRDENHQQILGADHEHQADGAEQDQRKIFADMIGEFAGRGNQHGENRQPQQRDFHEIGRLIHDEQAVEQIKFYMPRERQNRRRSTAEN